MAVSSEGVMRHVLTCNSLVDEATTSAPYKQSSPPAQPSVAFEIFTRIKHTIGAQTHLSDADTFWIISTGFQEALAVLPCLAITGPAH